MLKKKLGIEAIEEDWEYDCIYNYYKIPSTLIIPEGNKRIGNSAFWGCDWLKKVEIPGSVKFIGELAFKCCSNLKKVKIPDSVEWIGDWAFFGCTDTDIILRKPESEFKYIGRNALFSYRNVKEETGN